MSNAGVEKVFKDIFDVNAWNGNESVSGTGSSKVMTHRIISELPKIMVRYKIRSILDLPCGDFNWMRHVDLTGVDYIGGDIVDDLIESNKKYQRPGVRFEKINILSTPLPSVDLVFVRDCFVHLTFEQAWAAIRNIIRSNAKWMITTTFPGREINRDIPTGRWRPLNLEIEPFCLPTPERYLFECCIESGNRYRDKSLGLWNIGSIML